jgi:hypothetical protein
VDVTRDYLATSRAWRAARVQRRDELRDLDPEIYDYRLAQGAREAAAIASGLLRRSLYVATRPSS